MAQLVHDAGPALAGLLAGDRRALRLSRTSGLMAQYIQAFRSAGLSRSALEGPAGERKR